MKLWFNFEVNEVFSLEKILRATFLNPDRAKFENSISWGSNVNPLDPEILDADTLIDRINREMPNVVTQFNY